MSPEQEESTALLKEAGDTEAPNAFEDASAFEIRRITRNLGGVVERVVLELWQRETYTGFDVATLEQTVDILVGELSSLIGTRRLHPVDLFVHYQEVLSRRRAEVQFLFECVDHVCDILGVYGSGPTFTQALELLDQPGYLYGRYWLDGALMIAKEILDPAFELEEYTTIVRGVRVGRGIVVFDGLVVPFVPGIGSPTGAFQIVQEQVLNWTVVEIKAMFAWWRITGKDLLRHVPKEHARILDANLEQVASWCHEHIGGEYFPDYAVLLYCLRGWQPNRIFMREWTQKDWELLP
ncbi:hypothetical protein JW766_02190 [Candidatus Dojkabacteria bacterium]|nr:hypothetical protein [Candidatus Dojkabacteria bacterium]